MVARCSKTGKIVATRFGEVLTKEAIEPRPNIKFLGGDFSNQTSYLGKKGREYIHFLSGNMPNWVPVPKKLRKWGAFREVRRYCNVA